MIFGKWLARELYDANYDKELINDRYKAKDISLSI
ncbi:MAG: maltose acetyltransferase domain-containing protein [Clostridia bacterium]|nr:maltose acetyltransferase domain-containing protein [Clostridia bacterium]